MYIVGIDIAKRFHEAAIIDRNGNVVVKRIRFANSHAGFLKLMNEVRKLDAHLRQAGQTVHVINPLQSDVLRSMFIRQTKNDIFGTSLNSTGKMTKRGSHYLLTALFRATFVSSNIDLVFKAL